MFNIDNDGYVYSMRELDAEAVQDEDGYWLVVYAVESFHHARRSRSNPQNLESLLISSSPSGPLHTIAELFIEVLDENDHFPITQLPHYHCQLVENSPAKVILTRITASDSDNKDTTSLTYQLTAGDPQGHFIIDTRTGILSTTERSLDRETVLKDTRGAVLNLMVSGITKNNFLTMYKFCFIAI
ncbi:unnamed protein product [Trichobilharzia regenti]|nr:unnamed protein product [Trichobilharzia regenti]